MGADEAQVYDVCSRTCKDGLEDHIPLIPELKNVYADRIVGPYVTLHPEFCFVVEVRFGARNETLTDFSSLGRFGYSWVCMRSARSSEVQNQAGNSVDSGNVRKIPRTFGAKYY